jgi:GNS1/SUR4 family
MKRTNWVKIQLFQMVDLCYVYFLFKIIYIAESTVAELGKKSLLKSNFFVFHHIVIAIIAWLVANYHPGGHMTFLILMNSFVHVTVSVNFVVILLFPQKTKKFSIKAKNFFQYLMVRKLQLLILGFLVKV